MARGEAGAQRGGCHGGPGSEEEGQGQVPRQVRRTEWAKEALGNLGHLVVRGEEGTCSCFQGTIEGEKWHLGLEGRRWV